MDKELEKILEKFYDEAYANGTTCCSLRWNLPQRDVDIMADNLKYSFMNNVKTQIGSLNENKQADIDKLEITAGSYKPTESHIRSHYALMNKKELFRTKDYRELKMFVAELEARIILAKETSQVKPR